MSVPLDKEALLDAEQVLVLSTGYEPLFTTNWKRAITAIFSGRAEAVEFHKSLWIGTGSKKLQLPVVVRFLSGVIAGKLKNVSVGKRPSKKSIWSRDGGKCQYCSKKLSVKECTIDHVIPKSKNGPHVWENVVIACRKCNQKKGSKLPSECDMFPKNKPTPPPSYVPFVK